MIELLYPLLAALPPVLLLAAFFEVHHALVGFSPTRILPQAFGALHTETEVVRALQGGIVRKQDRFTVRALDLRIHNVAAFESHIRVRV